MNQEKPIAPEPLAIPVPAFALRYSYNARTVHRWCDKGMPHIGTGRARRVFWRQALAWLSARQAVAYNVHDGVVLQ